MTYKYKCGDEIIHVWCWDTDYHDDVSVNTKEDKVQPKED